MQEIEKIISNSSSEKELSEHIEKEIRSFKEKHDDIEHKVDIIKVKIYSKSGAAAVAAGSEVIDHFFNIGPLTTTLLLGSLTLQQISKHGPEIMGIVRDRQKIKSMSGYLISKPYHFLLNNTK